MNILFPDALESKICPQCGQPKSLKKFPPRNEWCRQCLKEAREAAPPGKGFCVTCKQYLPHSAFSPHLIYSSTTNKEGHTESACRKCTSRRSVELSRQKYDAIESRDKNLQQNHGITLAEYNTMLQAQGGVCAICKLPEKFNHHKSKAPLPLCVDHDHATGKVRGLLCSHCNRAMGILCEDLVRIQAMMDYIRMHRTG